MSNIEHFIRTSEHMIQTLVNDKLTGIREKLKVTRCSRAYKIISLSYFVEIVQVLSQNNIFLDDAQTIGVKFLNYHHDQDSSFNISLDAENNLLISTKQDMQIPCLDMIKFHFGLYIASGDLLEINQHSKRELYLNCPITMAPVHHWPEFILMNLSKKNN